MKKSIVIFASIGLLVLILAGIFIVSYAIPQSTVGSSSLGLQEVRYFKSSSECFDSSKEKLWMYTFRGGGLGQWADASVSPSEIEDFWSGSERPEETFRVDSKYDQYCVYPLVANSYATPVYTLSDPIEWSCTGLSGPLEEKAKEKCGSADTYYYGYYSTPLFTCWCSKAVKKTGAVGSSPNFNNPSTKTEMTIEVDANNQQYSETFTSDEKIKGKVGNNVCAVWQGNTVTGSKCGLPSKDVTPAYINGQWKLLSEDYYETYKTKWNTLKQSFEGTSKSSVENAISNLNYYSDLALTSTVSFGTIDEPTSLNNAKIEKKLSSLIEYPVMTLYIKADWIGVVTPIPNPKIKSISSECFGSGRTGKIKVEIKNEGDERGEVDVYGSCSSGFDIDRKSISILKGETKTIYLDITGTTDQEKLEGSCTIYADALENIDQKSVEVCVTGYAQCTEGEEWCEGGNAWWCPDPMNPEIKEDCEEKGQVCNYADDGTTFCADSENWCDLHPEDPICGQGACGCWFKIGNFCFPDIWCYINNFILKFKWIFTIVAGFLGGLLGSSYIGKLTPKSTTKRNKRLILLITFIVLGLAIGYLSFLFFWWIILALIILGIIRAFVPGV